MITLHCKRTCVAISAHQGWINFMRFSLLFSLLSEMSSISSLDDDLVRALSREVASVQVPGALNTNTDNIESGHSGQYWMMILGNVVSTGSSKQEKEGHTFEHPLCKRTFLFYGLTLAELS